MIGPVFPAGVVHFFVPATAFLGELSMVVRSVGGKLLVRKPEGYGHNSGETFSDLEGVNSNGQN